MFQVFCRSPKKYAKWVPYSGIRKTRKEAEAIKEWAENQHTCDLDGNLLIYKVREADAPTNLKEEHWNMIAENNLKRSGFEKENRL